MKEIKTLIKELKGYPENFFAIPYQELWSGLEHGFVDKKGLIICDLEGTEQGFINLGGKGNVVTNEA